MAKRKKRNEKVGVRHQGGPKGLGRKRVVREAMSFRPLVPYDPSDSADFKQLGANDK